MVLTRAGASRPLLVRRPGTSYDGFQVTGRPGGALAWHRVDVGAVLESGTSEPMGNWFSPIGRQDFEAAITSSNTISRAVVGDSEPLVRTVRCRTAANTLSIGLVPGMEDADQDGRRNLTLSACGTHSGKSVADANEVSGLNSNALSAAQVFFGRLL